jgi:hypothetical protein
MSREHYELAVIGAGSGGLGAALAGARQGLRVLLVEAYPLLGGTSTVGGVNCWEMGVGGTGLPFEIYCRLRARPEAVGVYSLGRHFRWQEDFPWPHHPERCCFPGGEHLIDPARRYTDTLRRHPEPGRPADEAWIREHWHGVPFEPEAFNRVARELLEETGRVTLREGVCLGRTEAHAGRVERGFLSDGGSVTADAWIDATGDAVLVRQAGGEVLYGVDPRSRFGEPGAPDEALETVNGATLIYRVSPAAEEAVEALPDGVPAACWWQEFFPPLCCNQYPDGDLNCNMLPTMQGREFRQLGYEAAYLECRRRVHAHWHFLQTHYPEFRRFRLSWLAPLLGVRESHRTLAATMLTEHDLRHGLSAQPHPDIVTIADHALDRHGEGGGCAELAEPYGVPYRCLIPRGFENLLVACRAAGFSAIAASSCRLSRTMMQLGQAAGTAAALARQNRVPLPEVRPGALRRALADQHVQLTWPLPEELLSYLRKTEEKARRS